MSDPAETDLVHFAVQHGDLAKVKELIAAGEPINGFDDTHKTPLHYAVGAQRLDIAQVLLDVGADVNAHDEDHIGDTALGDIAASCSLEVAQFLIAAGADPTIRGWMQLTALDRASERKRAEGRQVFELLRSASRR